MAQSKEKILGLIISQQERQDLKSGAMQLIKRPMPIQPDFPGWMDQVIKHFPDLKMFDRKGRQLFWLMNPNTPTIDKKGRDSIEIKPKYMPGSIIWCQYSYRQSVALGSTHKKNVVDKKATSTSSASSSIENTEIYLIVTQVTIDKVKGKWNWVYWVKLTDKPKYLSKP